MIVRAFVVITLLISVACGGGDDDDSGPTTSPGPLQCESTSGSFTTAMQSCDEAIELGVRLATEIVGASPVGAEIILAVTCGAIQDDQPMTYSFPEDLELAVALDEQGVCPGNVDMLVPK